MTKMAMPLDSDVVDVWLAFDAQFQDAKVQAQFVAVMSPQEGERMRRLHLESGRRQFALTRALQRHTLSAYATEVAPAEWQFQSSPEGRPFLAPPFDRTGLHFNIAHTAGLAVMAVCRHARVGVDVEKLRRAPLEVAERYFSAAEAAHLRALPPEAQTRRFLQVWTLKEAYLKAVGVGLAGGLGRMSFHLDAAEELRFESEDDADAARWQFSLYEPSVDHVLAVAVLPHEGNAPLTVTLREFRAPGGPSGQEQRAQA
jgi:4'-phosphopantetheinyl transferase